MPVARAYSEPHSVPKILRDISRALAAVVVLASIPLGQSAAKAEDGLGYAHKVCDIYEAPIERATFAGGAGCTWLIGEGDIGTTRTEITMIADRNVGIESIVLRTQIFDDLISKFSVMRGYRVRELQLNCGANGATGRMILWGIPSKSNIMGYAVCGNHWLHGSIHTPPNSDLESEVVFEKLMKAMAGTLNS